MFTFRHILSSLKKSPRNWRYCQFCTSSINLSEKTSLYDFHVKNHGKMVNFAGYLLPIQYSDIGISASHLHTRKNASIFDVSHMLQTYVRGKDCIDCFESLCPADLHGLKENSGTLTVFTNEKGKIYDDLIVTKISSNFLYVVSNAAMKEQDMKIMDNAANIFRSNGKDVTFEYISSSEKSLLAIQGPKSISLLQKLTDFNFTKLYFMNSIETDFAGVKNCRITRCGYTGEDGVEISIPAEKSVHIIESILETNQNDMKLAGLGARDSLRLEAGLCLYGTDIDCETTPVEASLGWLISKRRRNEENFPGARILNEQLNKKSQNFEKIRIGFRMFEGPPARNGNEIYTSHDRKLIGKVTSGCPSPSLGENIGMGYVREEFRKNGIEIQLKIRDKFYSGIISKMPFITTKYYLAPK